MDIHVELENGLLPDRFGKYAPAEDLVDGHPCVSFPIEVRDVPAGTRSLALTFLDWDAIPVGGFCWIHWIACNFPADTALIPENASASGAVPCVQGSNSDFSPLAGGHTDPRIIHRYAGPYPPRQDARLHADGLCARLRARPGRRILPERVSPRRPRTRAWPRPRSSCPAAPRGRAWRPRNASSIPCSPSSTGGRACSCWGPCPRPPRARRDSTTAIRRTASGKCWARCGTSTSRSASKAARRFCSRTASPCGTCWPPATSRERPTRASRMPCPTTCASSSIMPPSRRCSPPDRRRPHCTRRLCAPGLPDLPHTALALDQPRQRPHAPCRPGGGVRAHQRHALPDARPQPCAHAGAHQALTSLRAYTTNATARPTTA